MRTVPTSGGVELGPQDGPWIDVVPLSWPAPRGRQLVQLADAVVAEGGDWQPWQGSVRRVSAAPPGLVGITGILPSEESPRLLVMFRWWEREGPIASLRRIEEAEEGLPLALAAACLLAARAEGSPGRAPVLLARSAAQMVQVAPDLGRQGQQGKGYSLALACALAAAAGGDPPAVPTTSEAARVLVRLSRLLWREETAGAVRQAFTPAGRWQALEEAAAAGAIAWGIERAAGPFGSLPVPSGAEGRAWTAYAEAVGTGIPRAAWRHLAPQDGPLLGEEAWPAGKQAVDEGLCGALAEALLLEARGRARYAVQGDVALVPPREVAAAFGIRKVSLWADGQGIWAALETDRGRTPPFRWAGEAPLLGPVVPRRVQGLVRLLLAAAWRDLTVGGEEAAPSRRRGTATAQTGTVAGRSGKRGLLLRALPARPAPAAGALVGDRVWAGPRERRAIRSATAVVRGHLRRLPEGWAASPEAERAAGAYGLVLPRGHTFVRPHLRGGTGKGRDTAAITARGLASLLSVVGDPRR